MNEDAWRDFWSGGGDVSHALGGKHAGRLESLWRAYFSQLAATGGDLVVADIAAGAGAVLKIAQETLSAKHPKLDFQFLAVDVSQSAVISARNAIPKSAGVVSEGAALPLADRSVHVAVSQFGLEYAGLDAFSEAARILASSGRFCAISHYSGGGIERECEGNARLLEEVEATGLYETARAAFAASYELRRRGAQPASGPEESAFGESAKDAIRLIAGAGQSAAKSALQQFVTDLGKLSTRRLAYEENEALAWIGGMHASLSAYCKRMRSMCAAALDERNIRAIAESFSKEGLVDFDAEPLKFDSDELATAWQISATRP